MKTKKIKDFFYHKNLSLIIHPLLLLLACLSSSLSLFLIICLFASVYLYKLHLLTIKSKHSHLPWMIAQIIVITLALFNAKTYFYLPFIIFAFFIVAVFLAKAETVKIILNNFIKDFILTIFREIKAYDNMKEKKTEKTLKQKIK